MNKKIKKCLYCDKYKNIKEFRIGRCCCKECRNQQGKKRYVENSKFIYDYLKKHPCVDCGNANPVVLEFDHVFGNKKNTISDLWRKGYSVESIKKELEKCEIRCSNCHQIKTAKEMNSLKYIYYKKDLRKENKYAKRFHK
jgi:hypothetical protein